MIRSFTFSSVAACLVLSAVVLLPSEPWAKARPTACAFEVQVASDESGLVQLYYDIGRGVNEADSALQPVVAGHPALLRFKLPSGTYRSLRLDPLDRDARMTLGGARIADGSGRTLLALAPERFVASFQIDSLSVRDGRVSVATTPRGTDPQLGIRLDAPFTLPPPSLWSAFWGVFAASMAGLLLLGWARASARVRLDERARSAWRAAAASPAKALAAAAFIGMVAANYPVIFAGKSVVSPSFDAALLYGQNPWLPGYQSVEVGDPHKADIGALVWHHVPLSMIERRALFHDHELPLWNRYDSAGLPLLGQGQSCFGDPLQFIPILADGAAWAWDLKFLIAKGMFAFGIGLCVWRAFRHLPTALLLTVSASFMGIFVYRINHPAIFSLCYAPWILYCWLRCVDARSARGAVLAMAALVAANWVEMNSGTVKEAYILLLSMNFTGLCLLVGSERTPRDKARLLGGLLAAGGIFALIGSPVWYTFYRALQGSYTSYNAPLAFQIQPGMVLGLFDEAFYRPFQLEAGVVNPSSNAFVLIGLAWVVIRWRSLASSRAAAALLLSGLPALALVFGVVPPALIARVPFLGNILHIDNTFSCALIVVLTVLSGFGWREAWERLGTKDGSREAAAAGVILAGLFAAFLGTAQAIVRSAYFASTWGKLVHVDGLIMAYGASLIAGCAAFLWAVHRARSRGAPTAALLIIALLGFGAFHWREGLQLRAGFTDYVVRPPTRMDFHADSPTVDALRAGADGPSRALGFHNDLFPGWSIVYGLEGICGPDALINPYYRQLLDASGVKRIWDWRYIVEPGDVAALRPILDALNVRFYVGYHLNEKRPGRELRPVISADMDAYESPSAWPRAFFTDSAAVYSDLPQFCSWLKFGDGRPFAGIERVDWDRMSPSPRVSGDLKARTVTPARDYRITTNTTSFTVSAAGPGFIVLTEAYESQNFRALVNGREVPYVRVNGAFKGVYVDAAGTYAVSFSYWPRGFSASLVLFGAGLVLGAGALCVALRIRPPLENESNRRLPSHHA